METISMLSCTPYLSLEVLNEIEIIVITFKRFIRAEVVTYHSDFLGSLRRLQFHGFDEQRNGQVIIRNCGEKIDTNVVSFYPHHISVFDFFDEPK
jgi:hypothetical protein